MMKNYKFYMAGEKGRAMCPHCAKLVTTTFSYQNVPFNDGNGVAKDILASVCDECSMVVGIPAQSTPAIRHAREKAEIPLEVILSAPEVEILDAAAYQIDPQATSRFRKAIFAYYLDKLRKNPAKLQDMKVNVAMWLKARQAAVKVRVPSRRVSFKLSKRTEDAVQFAMTETGMNKTKLAQGIVMLVEKEVLIERARGPVQDLQNIAVSVNA